MSNSIRHDFHSDMASLVYNEIQYNRSSYYYFLGKVETWGIGDTAPSVDHADSDFENALIRSNAIFAHKISPNDVSLVAARNDWRYNTVYQPWDNTKNVEGTEFFVLTSEFNVYKCLNNNHGAPSLDMPTGQSFFVFYTPDGYLWKYMYNIPTFKQSRFTSSTYIPVQKALSNSFYNRGSADDVAVVATGSGYDDVQMTFINVTGTTSGSGAAGTIIANSIGKITGVVITNGGTGYTAGVAVKFNTVAGSSGTGNAVIVGGVVTGVTIITDGIGYVTGQTISFTVGGAIIIPTVSRVTGTITDITILNNGAGYIAVPTLTVSSTNGFGAGKYGNSTALVSATLFGGRIASVYIRDPGIGYPADTSTSIVVQGDGVGAAFSPVVYMGSVVDVVVENSGFGYTSMKLIVVGNGTGALLNPIISSSDYTSNQSLVEQTTVPGAIYSIQVVDGGNNYTSTTQVTVTGDGVGCTAVATVLNGDVMRINVTAFGTGYTYANINFTDVNRTSLSTLINATAYAILPPTNGHGYDAVSELYGNTLAINSSLRQDVQLNQLGQDYRQFGIIKNPNKLLSNSLFHDTVSIIAYNVLFNTVIGLVADEIILLNGIKFRVVSISGNYVMLQQLGVVNITPIGQFSAELDGTRLYTAISVVSSPTMNKYSGRLLYVSNENPFSFSEAQGIIIKTFLKF